VTTFVFKLPASAAKSVEFSSQRAKEQMIPMPTLRRWRA